MTSGKPPRDASAMNPPRRAYPSPSAPQDWELPPLAPGGGETSHSTGETAWNTPGRGAWPGKTLEGTAHARSRRGATRSRSRSGGVPARVPASGMTCGAGCFWKRTRRTMSGAAMRSRRTPADSPEGLADRSPERWSRGSCVGHHACERWRPPRETRPDGDCDASDHLLPRFD